MKVLAPCANFLSQGVKTFWFRPTNRLGWEISRRCVQTVLFPPVFSFGGFGELSFETAFTGLPAWETAALFFAIGVFVGLPLTVWIHRLVTETPEQQALKCPSCGTRDSWLLYLPLVGELLTRGRCRGCGRRLGRGALLVQAGTGLLFAGLVLATIQFEAQRIPDFQPAGEGVYHRLIYQLVLITLLVAASGTDLKEYLVPDQITVPGMIIGIAGATLLGNVHIVPLWIDWNQVVPGLLGPYIPRWMLDHPHLHGFAWSVTGLIAGAALTGIVRSLSALLLGRQALGFGDVTLMAMIGSFLGWQAVILVFLLAPICGMCMGIATHLLARHPYVPYGPYLAAAAVVVLMSWKWLWEPTRPIFGDWPSLAILSGVALFAFVVLLVLLRLYRMIPGKRRTSGAPVGPELATQNTLGDSEHPQAEHPNTDDDEAAEPQSPSRTMAEKDEDWQQGERSTEE